MSRDHMDSYLQEFCWRFNRRALQPQLFRHGITQSVGAEAAHIQETYAGDFLALRLTPPSLRGLGAAATSLKEVGGVLISVRRTASNLALLTP
jgi:hypothetical protein